MSVNGIKDVKISVCGREMPGDVAICRPENFMRTERDAARHHRRRRRRRAIKRARCQTLITEDGLSAIKPSGKPEQIRPFRETGIGYFGGDVEKGGKFFITWCDY